MVMRISRLLFKMLRSTTILPVLPPSLVLLMPRLLKLLDPLIEKL